MDSTDYYLDRIEELTHKLTQAEKKVQAFDTEKQDDQAKVGTLFHYNWTCICKIMLLYQKIVLFLLQSLFSI